MFQIKPLVRKSSPRFNVTPMVRRNLKPHQDRSSFIAMEVQNGKTYTAAIRSWDTKARENARANR